MLVESAISPFMLFTTPLLPFIIPQMQQPFDPLDEKKSFQITREVG
jgi:hypothetical protein